MSQLLRNIHAMEHQWVSNESLIDKDNQKNQAYARFAKNVQNLFIFPLAFQFWQLYLVNNTTRIRLYNQVRQLKVLSLGAALTFSVFELSDLNKRWAYLNRLYPEPTQA